MIFHNIKGQIYFWNKVIPDYIEQVYPYPSRSLLVWLIPDFIGLEINDTWGFVDNKWRVIKGHEEMFMEYQNIGCKITDNETI